MVVFAPVGQRWFVAAVRARRLLVDVGRVDVRTKDDPVRTAAVVEVATRHATVPIGTPLLLRGGWGLDTARVSGFDVWNGRLVATLALPDSLAARAAATSALVASAMRLDLPPDTPAAVSAAAGGAVAPAAPPATGRAAACDDSTVVLPDADRIRHVRDSLVRRVREAMPPPTVSERRRGRRTPTLRTTTVVTCAADGPGVLLAVSLRGHLNEWVQQRVVLVRTTGVRATTLRDLRFKGHELLASFDADGDGIDDLATRAVAERSGGTTLLRWNPASARYERLAAGFQWESQ
jgi:hypothetical protein